MPREGVIAVLLKMFVDVGPISVRSQCTEMNEALNIYLPRIKIGLQAVLPVCKRVDLLVLREDLSDVGRFQGASFETADDQGARELGKPRKNWVQGPEAFGSSAVADFEEDGGEGTDRTYRSLRNAERRE